MTISVIICTVARQKWVDSLLVSLSNQSFLPDQVLIVDASKQEISYSVPKHLNVRVIRSHRRGLTFQKNLGLDQAKGEVVFFLDDDILLDRQYIEHTMMVFQNDSEKKIGAVSGYITNQWGKTQNNPGWQLKLAKRLKIYDGDFTPGSVSPSGVFIELNGLKPFTGLKYVDFVPGGCTAVRADVFQTYRPPLSVSKYGGEDKCFSRMIAQRWGLCVCGDALLQHFSAPGGPRPSDLSSYRSTVEINSYIQKKYGKAQVGLISLRAFFIFAAFNMFLIGVVRILSFSKIALGAMTLFRALGYLVGALTPMSRRRWNDF